MKTVWAQYSPYFTTLSSWSQGCFPARTARPLHWEGPANSLSLLDFESRLTWLSGNRSFLKTACWIIITLKLKKLFHSVAYNSAKKMVFPLYVTPTYSGPGDILWLQLSSCKRGSRISLSGVERVWAILATTEKAEAELLGRMQSHPSCSPGRVPGFLSFCSLFFLGEGVLFFGLSFWQRICWTNLNLWSSESKALQPVNPKLQHCSRSRTRTPCSRTRRLLFYEAKAFEI